MSASQFRKERARLRHPVRPEDPGSIDLNSSPSCELDSAKSALCAAVAMRHFHLFDSRGSVDGIGLFKFFPEEDEWVGARGIGQRHFVLNNPAHRSREAAGMSDDRNPGL